MATPYKSVLLGMFGLLVMLPMVAQEPISKKFAKSYDFSNDGEVNIENKYGKINLYGWDKDEISISLDITVDHKRKEDSKELLSRIKRSYEERRIIFPSPIEWKKKVQVFLVNCLKGKSFRC